MIVLRILLASSLVLVVLDLALARFAPHLLRAFALVPWGPRRAVEVHPDHLLGVSLPSQPVDLVVFRAETTEDDQRFVPVAGGTSAMIVSTGWLPGGEATARLDAEPGGTRDRVVLRARITPSTFLAAFALPGLVYLLVGPTTKGLIVMAAMIGATVAILRGAQGGIESAIETTAKRLESPPGENHRDVEDDETEPRGV